MRWAGDEFVAGLHDAPGENAGETIRHRLQADPKGPTVWLASGDEVTAAYSVGHAVYRTGESIAALLDHADTDFSRAKQARARQEGATGA